MYISKCQRAVLLMLLNEPASVDGMNALSTTIKALYRKRLIRLYGRCPLVRYNDWKWELTPIGRSLAQRIGY